MNIALVDDDAGDRLRLEQLLKEYGTIHGLDLCIDQFSDAEAFCAAMNRSDTLSFFWTSTWTAFPPSYPPRNLMAVWRNSHIKGKSSTAMLPSRWGDHLSQAFFPDECPGDGV